MPYKYRLSSHNQSHKLRFLSWVSELICVLVLVDISVVLQSGSGLSCKDVVVRYNNVLLDLHLHRSVLDGSDPDLRIFNLASTHVEVELSQVVDLLLQTAPVADLLIPKEILPFFSLLEILVSCFNTSCQISYGCLLESEH